MLSATVARTPKVALSRSAKPHARVARRASVKVFNQKKSKQQELDEAYEEQLAYLQRRRERLISPRAPKKQVQNTSSAAAPIVEPVAPKPKAKAPEPSIKIAVEAPKQEKQGGNPLGFLSSLFGAK